MTNDLLNYLSMVWPYPSPLKQGKILLYVYSLVDLGCNQ